MTKPDSVATPTANPGPYGALAGANVLNASRRRRDRILEILGQASEPLLALTVTELIQRDGELYNYHLACKDLRELERYALVRSVGHPKRWTATQHATSS